jgi:RNA polymerase sigma-70 factor (ECF subfamily)
LSTDELHEQFQALYKRTYAKVVGFAARRTRTPEDAADAVAETFTIAWRRFDQVPAGEPALYWLYATARFVLANQERADRRRTVTVGRIANDLRWIFSDRTLPVEDERATARALLEELSADDRNVLLLAAWEGLDASGIAAVMGCSATAARIRLHRARRRLIDLLGEERQVVNPATVPPSTPRC